MTRWTPGQGSAYAARMRAVAATGVDMHGEATFCTALIEPGARILDAGCGTGRVSARLHELGYRCVGVDADPSMLAEAPLGPTWVPADLADLPELGRFDLVLAAGNVIPLVDDPAAVIAELATCLEPGGFLVSGFGLDRAHLPRSAALVSVADYDAWCAEAGLVLRERYATWSREAWDEGGYAVSVSGPTRRAVASVV